MAILIQFRRVKDQIKNTFYLKLLVHKKIIIRIKIKSIMCYA